MKQVGLGYGEPTAKEPFFVLAFVMQALSF